MARTVALIVAGGSGKRFGDAVPKQYLALAGASVLRRSIEAHLAARLVDAVRVVIRAADRDLYQDAAGGLDLPAPVIGGAERQDSVRAGLEALAGDPPERVLIHDAARPLASPDLIDRVVEALDRHDGAIAAIPVTDTLKRADEGVIAETVPRDQLWRAQTPQGFRYAAILAAHRRLAGQALTDDAAVAAAAGLAVALVEGDEENFKITTAADLARAERVWEARMGEIRVGQGFDVHAFGVGDHVMLCGIKVPHRAGLLGHSDADVGLHAITDALLGALADGDIGQHFKPTDPRWKGADSAMFLADAAGRVRARGGVILHVDLTVIGEEPRVGPYRATMTERVAAILGIGADRVGVKATTTEKLGFTGRGEGLAAQAVATIRVPATSPAR